MKIKSHLTKIFCTFSLLALIINQQLDTKTENQVQAIPRDSIAQIQGTNVPFEVCFNSDTFVRPSPREQINLIRKEFGHRIDRNQTDAELLNDGRWKSDILTFSVYYGASSGGDLLLFTGLEFRMNHGNNKTLVTRITKCFDKFFETHLTNRQTQVFLFKYKLKQIRWENSKYIFVVEPRNKGLQILHYRKTRQHLASNKPFPIEVIDTKGNTLGKCGTVYYCELKLKK
jgi:hypothetical protein